MKKVMLLFIVVISCILVVSYTGSVMAGEWSFDITNGNVFHNPSGVGYRGWVEVQNNSTDTSYGSGGVYYGTVIVSITVSSPDAGTVYFHDERLEIQNGSSDRAVFDFTTSHDYGILTMDVKISSPGGGVFDTYSRTYNF